MNQTLPQDSPTNEYGTRVMTIHNIANIQARVFPLKGILIDFNIERYLRIFV